MKPIADATVSRSKLLEAALPVRIGKRGRRGAKRSVPADTLIYREGKMLIMDAPLHRSVLPMRGTWSICISVQAASLALVCPKLKLMETVSLIYEEGFLIIDNGLFRLPAREGDRPYVDVGLPSAVRTRIRRP